MEAINDYITKQNIIDPVLLAKRAILYYELGNFDDAYSSLDQALKKYPDNNSLHQAASQIHYLTGNLLKDPAATVDYHTGKWSNAQYANSPVRVEPDVDAVRTVIEERM